MEDPTPHSPVSQDLYNDALALNAEAACYRKAIISFGMQFHPLAHETTIRSIECLARYGNDYAEKIVVPFLAEVEDSLNLLCGMAIQYEYEDMCHQTNWDWTLYRKLKDEVEAATQDLSIAKRHASKTLAAHRMVFQTRPEDDSDARAEIRVINEDMEMYGGWNIGDPHKTPIATLSFKEADEHVKRLWKNHKLLIEFNQRLQDMSACLQRWLGNAE